MISLFKICKALIGQSLIEASTTTYLHFSELCGLSTGLAGAIINDLRLGITN